jgi:hypothetical protein
MSPFLFYAVVLTTGLGLSPGRGNPSTQLDTTVCPSEGPHSRLVIEQLLTDSTMAVETEVDGISIEDVVLLQDSTDAAACSALRTAYPPHSNPILVDTYFKAVLPGRTRFFVTRTPLPAPPSTEPGTVRVRHARVGVSVFDGSFNDLGGFTW